MAEEAPSSATRIRVLLINLLKETDRAIDEIEEIASTESKSAPDTSEKHDVWAGFGDILNSDTMLARQQIVQQIAALRGMLVIRGLDDSMSDYEAPSEEPQEDDE